MQSAVNTGTLEQFLYCRCYAALLLAKLLLVTGFESTGEGLCKMCPSLLHFLVADLVQFQYYVCSSLLWLSSNAEKCSPILQIHFYKYSQLLVASVSLYEAAYV
jgi:hypothetical protein